MLQPLGETRRFLHGKLGSMTNVARILSASKANRMLPSNYCRWNTMGSRTTQKCDIEETVNTSMNGVWHDGELLVVSKEGAVFS